MTETQGYLYYIYQYHASVQEHFPTVSAVQADQYMFIYMLICDKIPSINYWHFKSKFIHRLMPCFNDEHFKIVHVFGYLDTSISNLHFMLN